MNAPAICSAGWTSRGLADLVLVLAWLTVTAAGAQTNAPTAQPSTNEVLAAIPQSFFVSVPTQGKDPFFPNSIRRGGGPPPPPPPTNHLTSLPVLKLQGITGPANRRLALINNRVFGVGESGSVNAGGKKVTIKCEKIGPRSASIVESPSGQKEELHLTGD